MLLAVPSHSCAGVVFSGIDKGTRGIPFLSPDQAGSLELCWLASIIIMEASSLKGKTVKDYLFGEPLVIFDNGSQLAQVLKHPNMPLTIYAVPNSIIDNTTFREYNDEIAANEHRFFPAYYEIVRSANFVYMVFEQLAHLRLDNPSEQNLRKLVSEFKKLLSVPGKLTVKQVFMRVKGQGELCVVVPYTPNWRLSSNLYTQYHNKSPLAELLCSVAPVIDRAKAVEVFIAHCESEDLFRHLMPYFKLSSPSPIKEKSMFQPLSSQLKVDQRVGNTQFPVTGQGKKQKSVFNYFDEVNKSKANELIKEAQSEYPDINEEQFQGLMAYVHVNPNLKIEAQELYNRQSVRKLKDQVQNQITEVVKIATSSCINNIKANHPAKSMGTKIKKSKLKLNETKLNLNLFEVYYEAYYSTFTLFKNTIKSYLQKYKKGYAGIIAAYLITLIGILRRLELYKALKAGMDVFEIGETVDNLNYEKYLTQIKKELANEARNLVNFKNIIQMVNMPIQAYEAIDPYLQEDLSEVDLDKTTEFCFFYMTALMRRNKKEDLHDILSLEVMYVLMSPIYSIAYSEEEMPKVWNKEYFEMKKLIVQSLVPSWEV